MTRLDASRVVGARAATLATTVVAVLSLVTGVANILTPSQVGGPLTAFAPPAVQAATGFTGTLTGCVLLVAATGTLTGFVLLVAAAGMRRGLRASWFATVALLPITLTQGLLQATQLSVPLVVGTLVAAPSVALSRGRFERAVSLSQSQLAGGVAVVAVQLYGTAGAFALREQFGSVDTVLDAF